MSEPTPSNGSPLPPARPQLPPQQQIVQNSAESILLMLELAQMEIPRPVTVASEQYEVVIRKRPGIFRPRPKIVLPGR